MAQEGTNIRNIKRHLQSVEQTLSTENLALQVLREHRESPWWVLWVPIATRRPKGAVMGETNSTNEVTKDDDKDSPDQQPHRQRECCPPNG